MAWLQNILKSIGGNSTGGRGSRKRRPGRPSVATCARCGVRLRPNSVRCVQCGARAAGAPAPETTRSARTQGVGHREAVEAELLVAAVTTGDGSLVVSPPHGQDQGEIKAGERRFYGTDAMSAVETLFRAGSIESTGPDRFGVTRPGRVRVAAALAAGLLNENA